MRQLVSIADIKDRLLGQLDAVVDRYAPPANGSHITRGIYYTLNPGRADRSVGSFAVHMTGPKAGKWNDYATDAHGDVLDLIGLSLGLSDPADVLKEARAFLGLDTESPEVKRSREEAAARAKARRKAAEADAAEKIKRGHKAAQALWLSAQEKIAGTPVDHYLRGRQIDLSALGRQPRALRYHPECHYVEEVEDPTTGEVITRRLKLPAMLAAITDASGTHIGTHRTYLALGPDGRWSKAPLPDPKKVLGSVMTGSIRLSSGIGPKGGKAAPLASCPPGTKLYIAEGIETALSAMILCPDARVIAAYSLANMGAVILPANVAEVVLISDADPSAHAQEMFQRAVAAHAAQGRIVRVWRGADGQDLNDALKAALTHNEETCNDVLS